MYIIEKQEIVFFFFKLDFALIIELDLCWALPTGQDGALFLTVANFPWFCSFGVPTLVYIKACLRVAAAEQLDHSKCSNQDHHRVAQLSQRHGGCPRKFLMAAAAAPVPRLLVPTLESRGAEK